MIKVKPFAAVRPPRDKAHLVTSRSYVSYPKRELSEKLNGNPYTFIHIINPDFNSTVKTKPNSKERFLKVKEKYQSYKDLRLFIEDEKPGFYIYRQTSHLHCFTGIIACTSYQDYVNGKIKIHEQTLEKREEVFTEYLDTCGFHAEPVLMSHPKCVDLEVLKARICLLRPEYEFTTTDEILHELWLVDNIDDIKIVENSFAQLPAIYIADGHHRSASSVRLALKKRAEEQTSEELSTDFFMSYLLPEDNIAIYPFHRLVKTDKTRSTILKSLEDNFSVENLGNSFVKPSKNSEFTMFDGENWYFLKLKKEPKANSPLSVLAPQILSDKVLAPCFEITDLRNDKRIGFKGGNIAPTVLEADVRSNKFNYAFFLNAVSVEQLLSVADAGLDMPPKSTFVEPKLRSGLTVYQFKE